MGWQAVVLAKVLQVLAALPHQPRLLLTMVWRV